MAPDTVEDLWQAHLVQILEEGGHMMGQRCEQQVVKMAHRGIPSNLVHDGIWHRAKLAMEGDGQPQA
jgi:hypothetical protein